MKLTYLCREFFEVWPDGEIGIHDRLKCFSRMTFLEFDDIY